MGVDRRVPRRELRADDAGGHGAAAAQARAHSRRSRRAAIGSVGAGLLADRLGRTTITIAAMAVSGTLRRDDRVPVRRQRRRGSIAVCVVWGISIVADSAQFSASIAELADRARVGTMLTVQTALGFTLTLVTIHLMPYLVAALGWRYAFVPLALGPALGVWAMARLRAHPRVGRAGRRAPLDGHPWRIAHGAGAGWSGVASRLRGCRGGRRCIHRFASGGEPWRYHLEGRLLEVCNCRVLCPCWIGEDPDYGTCDTIVAWHFDKGTIDGVDVSDRTIAMIAHVPGNILQGNWRAAVYLDERVTPQQEEAILKRVHRQAGRSGRRSREAGRRGRLGREGADHVQRAGRQAARSSSATPATPNSSPTAAPPARRRR